MLDDAINGLDGDDGDNVPPLSPPRVLFVLPYRTPSRLQHVKGRPPLQQKGSKATESGWETRGSECDGCFFFFFFFWRGKRARWGGV